MNKFLTIVLTSYYSEKNLFRVLKNLTKYKIFIIENSLDKSLKKKIEKKYKNVSVVIPKENLGLAKAYNLGIKKAKTNFVYLIEPDIEIDNKSLNKLILCAQKLKNFSVLGPVYKKNSFRINYSKYSEKLDNKDQLNKKYKISKVNWIDNHFIINKKIIKKNLFDENYFLYFEIVDFCINLNRKFNNLFVTRSIKYIHYGGQASDIKYKKIIILIRAWHYNWSKFYFYRKNFTYIYAVTKILPNLIQAIKKIIINTLRFNKFNVYVSFIECYGILSSMLCLSSFYRAKNN